MKSDWPQKELDDMSIDESMQLYSSARDSMSAGDYAIAAELLQRSVSLDPHFKTLELLGECFLKLGRFQDAIVPLAAATALNRQARAPALLAEAFLKLSDFAHAREMCELAIQRNSQYDFPRSLLHQIETAEAKARKE